MIAKANFFIIGAGKSGTTALWSHLDQHPQVAMSTTKEPSFFSQDAAFAKGVNWYHQLYRPDASTIAMGEASNSYSANGHWPNSPARIAAYNPDARIIYIVRDPLTRTESDWIEYTRQYDISFSEFLANNELCHDKNDYPRQLEAYREHFPEEQILVLLFEDLIANRQSLLRRIGDFLGLDPQIGFAGEAARRASTEQGQHRPLALRIRRSILYRSLSRFLPQAIRKGASQFATTAREIDRPEWSETERCTFRERYEASSHKFLTDNGYDPARWPFE